MVRRATGRPSITTCSRGERDINLPHAVDPAVLGVDLGDLDFDLLHRAPIAPRVVGDGWRSRCSGRSTRRRCERGEDRLDPEQVLVPVDDQREGRLSSVAKKAEAEADRKIAFARRSLRISRSKLRDPRGVGRGGARPLADVDLDLGHSAPQHLGADSQLLPDPAARLCVGHRVLLRVEHHPHRPVTQLVGLLPRRHDLPRSSRLNGLHQTRHATLRQEGGPGRSRSDCARFRGHPDLARRYPPLKGVAMREHAGTVVVEQRAGDAASGSTQMRGGSGISRATLVANQLPEGSKRLRTKSSVTSPLTTMPSNQSFLKSNAGGNPTSVSYFARRDRSWRRASSSDGSRTDSGR